MYAPILENDSQTTLETSSAAIHEFRIPPKGLLGLHTYCPVHFDAFHTVLVDLSVHIVFLKAGSHAPSQKVTRFVPLPVLIRNIDFVIFYFVRYDNLVIFSCP